MNIRELAIAAFRTPSLLQGTAARAADAMRDVAALSAGQVRSQEVGLAAARRAAADHASRIKADLREQAAKVAPGDPAVRAALASRGEHIKTMAKFGAPEGQAAETNRLLRKLALEMELANRRDELKAKGFSRHPGKGNDAPLVARPEGLLDLIETASVAGDDVALEWARRELAGCRHLAVSAELLERVDLATTRPGEFNPAVCERHLATLRQRTPADPGALLDDLVKANDVTGLVALVAWANASGDPAAVTAVVQRAAGLPAPAVDALRQIDAEATTAARAAARAHVELAEAQIDAAARLEGVDPAAEAALARVEQSAAARAADAQRNGAALTAL